jgi:hypothetical protein
VSKNAKFDAEFESVEKVAKKFTPWKKESQVLGLHEESYRAENSCSQN